VAHIDVGQQVRTGHAYSERRHLEATQETTRMLMDADAAEARGEHYTADLTRRAAAEQQVAANKRWRPRSN
jgi:hypothetical protein